MRFLLPALFLATNTAIPAVRIRVATYNIGAHFTAEGYPDYSLGDPGTSDHDKVRDVLDRIDADVVALQEIASADVSGNPDDLDALAASLGYPYLYVAPVSAASPLAGPFDTSLRVAFLSRHPFLSTMAVRSPEFAKEITRLHPVVKVNVPGTSNDPLLISAHLKSGTAAADKFRRAVDFKRLAGHLNGLGLSNDDNYIIMGDFNLSSSNATYSAFPANMPVEYDLGGDIPFPVSYSTNPLSYFSSPAVTRLYPLQLNGSAATFQSGSVIDLIMVSPAIAGRPLETEIYNSTHDVSNSAGLPKAGSPLAAVTSAAASDHYAVFADLELDSDFPNLALGISSPTVNEGMPDGSVVLTATLPAIRTGAVTISVSSDAAAAEPVNPTIVIPAGALAGSVNLRASRNFLVDSGHGVTFTASAVGFDPASVVLQVNDVDGPYRFTTAGQTVSENFNGFTGTHDPAPWVTAAGTWQGIDGGSSTVAGLRAYGSNGETALGFLLGGSGSTASAAFENQTGAAIHGLRISFDVEAWRVPGNGAPDGISADLLIGGQTIPIPALSFVAGPSQAVGTVPLNASVTGLTIDADATFELRIHFNAASSSGPPPSDVFVNEFHYDNASTDTGEFVEIAVGPGFTGSLSGLALVLYNGNGGVTYPVNVTYPLNSFTVGATTASGHRLIRLSFNETIQNGDPDGFALVNTATAQVLQFLSYEGSFTATNGPAAGMTSVNIGVSQSGGDPAGTAALGLFGSGGKASDFAWKKFTGIAHSPGQPNDSQTFTTPSLPPRGLAIDNLSIALLSDSDQDGIVDSLDPDDDNDGQSDAYETAFGSDPRDGASRFLPVLARAAAAPHGLQLSFPGAQGISYTIESSMTLSGWQGLTTVAGNGQPIVVPLPLGGPRMFFRVRAGE